MLTSKSQSKPSRIQPGDEYASFGAPSIMSGGHASPTRSRKKKKSNKDKRGGGVGGGGGGGLDNNDDGFGSYGFDVGLSSTGSLTNPFGSDISDFDIEVSYAALSALSIDKRVNIEQFTIWVNNYLQLNWDESRIKRSWNEIDQEKKKYITFKEFKSGLKSTNSDVILFYSNLMVSHHIKYLFCDFAIITNIIINYIIHSHGVMYIQ